MFTSLGNSMILRGVLALAVGVTALAWPGVTVLALVILFAIYAFIAAGVEATIAFGSRTAMPVAGHLLLGLVDVVAGIVALSWPAATALVLVVMVGSWAVVTGGIEIAAGIRSGEIAGTRAMYVLGGLTSIAFGVVLFARPDVGALTLALLFGLFNLVSGTFLVARGIEVRKADKDAEKAVDQALAALGQPVQSRVHASV